MVSLRKMVQILYDQNNEITLNDLTKRFPEANHKTLGNCLSLARKKNEKPSGNKSFTKISMEVLEPLIAKKLAHNPTNQDLKLAVEILKIKQQDTSLMNEIDLTKFYKKAMEEDDLPKNE